MFHAPRLLSVGIVICFVCGLTISAQAGSTRIICYAFAFRKGGAQPEARTQAFGYKGNEVLTKRRAMMNCGSRYPRSKFYQCVPAGCEETTR